jgi:prolyl-tRNA editing enzyme YbaK/EbsC (Cys-tRNA(Pro) deacylase)
VTSRLDSEHPGVQRVIAALIAAGLPGAQNMCVLDDDVRTAAKAAAVLGIEVGAIANSLLFDADSEPLLALTSGAHRADPARLAALAGSQHLQLGGPDFVRTHTGQVIGGVAPIGHPRPIRTFVDVALRNHPVVWASCGHPRTMFPATFDELVALTGGTVAELAARP